MTATVETVSEQLDLPIMPVERVPAGIARAITLSESDVAMAKAQIVKAQVIGENDEPVDTDIGEDIDNFWQTSVGKFKFCVEELPQPLQYIHQLLQELSNVDKPDVLYYMLQCLNVLILHGDACTIASKEHKGFFIWCQENLLIKNLWELCNSEHSHICQTVVPLLLHCITLPAGSDVFWRVIQEAFHCPEWSVRFTAVERVTVITRFMDSSPLRDKPSLQAALANAFYLRNSDANSETLTRKIKRAQEALSQCDGSATSSVKTLSASFGTKWPYKRTMSAPASIIRQENKDGHMQSLNMVDDQNITTFLQRVIDLEEADKETMHLLVFLLMQFLSRSDQAYPAEEKNLAKTQGIVLRHLYLLLGYSQNDRGLYLPPQRLRSSPAFSVFLSNLPQLMDQNHLMGRLLLPTCLILMQYAPSPYYIPSAMEFQQPTYSLWALEPHFRKNWLMSIVVLLYKYQYNHQPHCMQLTSLIRVVLNTLDSQHHHCRRIPATIIMGQPPSRSRDVSQPSLGAEIEHPERATPPPSPIYSSDGQSVQVIGSSKCGKMQVAYTKPSSTTSMETHWEEAIHCVHPEKKPQRRHAEVSVDTDTESELMVIPDSDMSDSTLQGSVQDSFEDGASDSLGEKHLPRSPKESYTNQLVKIPNKGRPTWTIGSEEEFSKTCDNKIYQEVLRSHSELIKNCSRLNSTSSVNGIQVAKTVTTDFHKHVSSTFVDTHSMGKPKHKKIIEPSITPVCTPVSDCDESYKNNHASLPTPSLERLLPIGSTRVPDSPLNDDVFSPTIDSQLEIPCQERLLPIGQHPTPQLMEKLKQALGVTSQQIKSESIKKEKLQGHSQEQHHPQPTSSHSHSPRKLTKQVALESPNNSEFEDNGHFKSLKMENQSKFYTSFRIRLVATNAMYPWQTESNIHLPGGAISVAHQFLRCVLHQLAPNGIFTQMFQTNAPENIRIQFFKSVIQALIDFNELNPVAPIQLLLEVSISCKQVLLFNYWNWNFI
ncbi:unnamed protein product [Diabrotica balteata]|uniref:Uncharacterized protein n=1 Tax=Diabrotica balteata TaxID=107213 RepID=A0A9N9SV22_DIABA|nr:unnamed protein product [Diabrotica balteata]